MKSQELEPQQEEAKSPEQPEWLADELNSLNALKVKFSRKYKRTFKKIEECADKDECLAMTNEMYLGLMLRVLKTAGVDRGAILLQKLQDK